MSKTPLTPRVAMNGGPIIKFPALLPDGIYLYLDEDAYHADPALGSSNIRTLLKGANEYWHTSWMNKARPKEKLTESKIFGKAMHKLLLEGAAPFQAIYVRRPDDDEEASPADKSLATKAAKKSLKEGQHLLHGAKFDFIKAVKSIIDRDPELTGCLDNALTEVSVFWTRADGTRMKSRFDALKLRGYGDIKSIANERGHELGMACRYAIAAWRYDMQIEHYNEGRRVLSSLAAKELIFVSTVPITEIKRTPAIDSAIAFIYKIASQSDFAAQFVFVPKLGTDNEVTKAPDAWSTVISPANPGLKKSRDDIETALMIYRDALKKYGTETQWLPGRIVSELDWGELPYALSRIAP